MFEVYDFDFCASFNSKSFDEVVNYLKKGFYHGEYTIINTKTNKVKIVNI